MNKVNITLQIHAFYKQYHDSHYIVTSDERLRLVEFRGEQESRRSFVLFGTYLTLKAHIRLITSWIISLKTYAI